MTLETEEEEVHRADGERCARKSDPQLKRMTMDLKTSVVEDAVFPFVTIALRVSAFLGPLLRFTEGRQC